MTKQKNQIRVGITGANGFVGDALCKHLIKKGFSLASVTRTAHGQPDIDNFVVPSFTDQAGLTAAFRNCDVVVILAAKTHSGTEPTKEILQQYRQDNLDTAVTTFKAAAEAGVKRLIYLSSIKVIGESTSGIPFSASSIPNPEDAYGITKLETEQALQKLVSSSELALTIIRPPLIYGPGVKGNLRKLESAIKRGLPLPFASIRNKRALVSLERLCDLIRVCLTHPKAAGGVFLVSDGISRSTPDIIRMLATGAERKPILLPCPVSLLKLTGTLLGKQTQISRLIGDLEVDIGDTCRTLNWHPESIEHLSGIES